MFCSELKNIINPNKDDENVFLIYKPQIIEIQNKSNVFLEIDNENLFIYLVNTLRKHIECSRDILVMVRLIFSCKERLCHKII